MKGKTCLVTGATDGHGKAVAMALAREGAEVVLHGRSRDKILAVQDEIAAATDGKAPEILLCDLAIPREIDFAIRLLSRLAMIIVRSLESGRRSRGARGA